MTTTEELEFMTRCAEAERALTAAGEEKNPWAGAGEKLVALTAEHEKRMLRSKGERLVAALCEHEVLVREVERCTAESESARAQLAELEQHPTVLRWKTAPRIARPLGAGMGWEHFAKWFVSGRRAVDRTSREYPDEGWPRELQFSEADREVVLRRRDAEHDYAAATESRNAAQGRLRELLTEHPELQILTSAVG